MRVARKPSEIRTSDRSLVLTVEGNAMSTTSTRALFAPSRKTTAKPILGIHANLRYVNPEHARIVTDTSRVIGP